MSTTYRKVESSAGILSILLAFALLAAAVVMVAIMVMQAGTTAVAPYLLYIVSGLFLLLIVCVLIIAIDTSTPTMVPVESIDSTDGGRVQHRDTTGRFAAGSMGTLKTGEEGGTAVPEGAGSSAPGGVSSPGDKSPVPMTA